MDRDFSTPQKLLECPHGHASHLPGLAEGQLALLEQMASSRLSLRLRQRKAGDGQCLDLQP